MQTIEPRDVHGTLEPLRTFATAAAAMPDAGRQRTTRGLADSRSEESLHHFGNVRAWPHSLLAMS